MRLRTRLKIARKQFGHTQKAAARIMGVTQESVSYWEKGQKMPRNPQRIEDYILGIWEQGENMEKTYRITVQQVSETAYEVDADSSEEALAKFMDSSRRPTSGECLGVEEITGVTSVHVWDGDQDVWRHEIRNGLGRMVAGPMVGMPQPWRMPSESQAEMRHDAEQAARSNR